MLQYNGLTLAYVGDAIYEGYIRQKLIEQGHVQVNILHDKATAYTSAEGQAEALKKITSCLSEEELAVVKRGRNANSTRRSKNASLQTYKWATGFEALLGYLYLSDKKTRLYELLDTSFD